LNIIAIKSLLDGTQKCFSVSQDSKPYFISCVCVHSDIECAHIIPHMSLWFSNCLSYLLQHIKLINYRIPKQVINEKNDHKTHI
jgi:hypothetical protein